MQSLDKKVRLMEFNADYEELANYKIDVINTHGYIIDNVTNIASLNKQAFKKITYEARKYGFSDILKEATYYLALNNTLLRQTVKASKRYIARLNIH